MFLHLHLYGAPFLHQVRQRTSGECGFTTLGFCMFVCRTQQEQRLQLCIPVLAQFPWVNGLISQLLTMANSSRHTSTVFLLRKFVSLVLSTPMFLMCCLLAPKTTMWHQIHSLDLLLTLRSTGLLSVQNEFVLMPRLVVLLRVQW